MWNFTINKINMLIANPIYDSDFVELLTHDSYVIQVRRLARQARNRLERVLSVFNPAYQTTGDKHQLDFQGDANEPLVQKMIDRLGRAIASEDIREKMDVEDELDQIFEREMRKLAQEKDLIIAEKEQLLEEEKQRAEQEKQRAEAEKQRAEQEKQRAEAEKQKNLELQRQIEALKKQLDK